MLFNIEADTGSLVIAYLVLDDYSATPKILVRGFGREVEVEANETREALVSAGRHETGRCGFRLEVGDIVEIAAPDLELIESQSGVLIYRRRPPDAIDRKIFRLETSLFPLWRFDQPLTPRFHHAMTRIEHYGRETTTQLFLMNQLKSQYLSGRLFYKNFDYYIRDEFAVWVCVQRPFDELAERLLFLKNVRNVGLGLLSERDRIGLRGAVEFAEQLPFEDARALRRAMRHIPDDVAARLSNPLTRQLTAADADELPTNGSVAAALDVLARCELVGFRHAYDVFVRSAADLIGAPAPADAPPNASFALIRTIADALTESPAAERMLEKDLELLYYLTQAALTTESLPPA
jgi:hypothetical protein